MHLIADLIHEYGLIAVATIVALECIGFPVPGETALLGAAIAAGTKHDLNISTVIVVAAAAAIVGRMIGYAIGRQLGYRLVLQYGKYVGLTEGRIKLAQYLFLRHGGKIVSVAQFVPVLRSFAGLLAGANVMPWRNFSFANAVSSSVWAVSYGYAAYWAGREFETFTPPRGGLSSNYCRNRDYRRRDHCPSARGTIDRRGRSGDARASKIALMT